MSTEIGTALGIIGGGIITVLIAFFIEWIKKPRISLSITQPIDMTYLGRPIQNVRFLCITLSNRNLPWIFRFMQRNTATNCSGQIEIIASNGTNFFNPPMRIRWSSSPEPVMPRIQINGQTAQIFDMYRVLENSTIDIDAGSSERFDVVAKYDNDVECYGWNNECYLANWRIPERAVPTGIHRVRISLSCSGKHLTREITLRNTQTRDGTILV